MKNYGFWKQQWNSEVTASSFKATVQEHVLPSDGELDAFSYITTSLPEILVFIRTTIDW